MPNLEWAYKSDKESEAVFAMFATRKKQEVINECSLAASGFSKNFLYQGGVKSTGNFSIF